jgi:pimeloyl-ACP methyl ester carboxylesterase
MTTVYRSPAAAQAVEETYRRVLDGWPVPCERLTVSTDEGDTHVVACGPADAPPLILLHGTQANAAAWMFDAVEWSRRFRVFAIDLIGEPGLSAPSRPPLETGAHARWLNDVLAGLGVETAAFCGMSLGGFLALDYAVRHPARVTRLALIAPAGIGRQKPFALTALPLLLLGSWGAKKLRARVMGLPPSAIPEAARPLMEMFALIGRSATPRIVRVPLVPDAALRRLTMPVLAVVGGRDVLLDSAETRLRLTRAVPGARILWLPDGHHFIPGHRDVIGAFLCGEDEATS